MIDIETLSFLDGYIYRVMARMLRSDGPQESGLYDFYKARIERERRALSGYDRLLFAYLTSHFEPNDQQVLHAGIGVGTLASALAVSGFRVAGLERDDGRFKAASRVRAAVCDAWPEVAERYEVVAGTFPTTVLSPSWTSGRTILLFTNCAADWTDAFTDSIIDLFPRFGGVLLDSRLFGRVRDAEDERESLMRAIERRGLTATPLLETRGLGAYYHHIRSAAAQE